MLPFRSPLDWDSPFAAAVRHAAGRLADGFDHSKCTYGTLVRALPLQRVADRLPLTEIQFNLERLSSTLDFGGLTAKVTPNAKAAVTFDFFVNIIESAAGLRDRLRLQHRPVRRGDDRPLDGALSAGARKHRAPRPRRRSRRCQLLSAEQERFVLDTVNDTDARLSRESCIHDLFAAQAARTPDRRGLRRRRGRADLCRARPPVDRAGPRTAAGEPGAAGPDRRRRRPVAALLVSPAGRDEGRPRLCPARCPPAARRGCGRSRPPPASTASSARTRRSQRSRPAPSRFASTGSIIDRPDRSRPAARAVGCFGLYPLHVGLDGRAQGRRDRPPGTDQHVCAPRCRLCEITADDVVIASSAVTFDVSAAELFVPLIVGARVVMADRETVANRLRARGAGRQDESHLMQATPTLWRMLLEAGFASRPGLKMIAAGEPLPRDLADRLLAGGGRLWNLYGPTEATICASRLRDRAATAPTSRSADRWPTRSSTCSTIATASRRPAPSEHCSSAATGWRKGYFDRPDLTAQSFGTLSLAGRPPRRLYCTGDRARLLPSGDFELRGRNDRQVKLRGFRIELEEIESALRQAAGVRDCAVLLRHDAGSDPALVAYVVPAGGDPADVRADLAQRLPDYMVPAHWVELEALPLTAGGKLDRNALPRPAEAPRRRAADRARAATRRSRPRSRPCGPRCSAAATSASMIRCSPVGAGFAAVFRIAARLQARASPSTPAT